MIGAFLVLMVCVSECNMVVMPRPYTAEQCEKLGKQWVGANHSRFHFCIPN
jgi:hypothetical protein